MFELRNFRQQRHWYSLFHSLLKSRSKMQESKRITWCSQPRGPQLPFSQRPYSHVMLFLLGFTSLISFAFAKYLSKVTLSLFKQQSKYFAHFWMIETSSGNKANWKYTEVYKSDAKTLKGVIIFREATKSYKRDKWVEIFSTLFWIIQAATLKSVLCVLPFSPWFTFFKIKRPLSRWEFCKIV